MADLSLLTSATGRNAPINARTAGYALVLSDQGKVIEVNSTSAMQVTVPIFRPAPF